MPEYKGESEYEPEYKAEPEYEPEYEAEPMYEPEYEEYDKRNMEPSTVSAPFISSRHDTNPSSCSARTTLATTRTSSPATFRSATATLVTSSAATRSSR